MNDQYLWDGQGEPDPEIQELEKTLSGFRYRERPTEASRIGSITASRSRSLTRAAQFQLLRGVSKTRTRLWGGIGIAASLILASIFTLHIYEVSAARDSGWTISWNGSQARSVRIGQTIDTGSHSVAQLSSDFVGEVRIDADSRLQIMHAVEDTQRLALLHGTIHAFVWSPPGRFVVNTPSAKTIDLGCRYTLHIRPDGSGILQVETGWVAFQWKGLESFIPAGAECRTRRSQGPGTPYYDDAPATLTTALAQFDETRSRAALHTVLTSARPRDALTIWHLLRRTQGAERLAVFTRFRALVTLPSAITQETILRGDPSAIDASWNALGLGNTDWWREWKRRW